MINSCCSLINYCFSKGYDFTQITLRVCKPCARQCYQNEFCATTVHSLLPFRFEWLYRYMLWSNSCTGSIRHYLSICISVIEFLISHVRSLNPSRATYLRGRRWSQSYNEWYGLDVDGELCWRSLIVCLLLEIKSFGQFIRQNWRMMHWRHTRFQFQPKWRRGCIVPFDHNSPFAIIDPSFESVLQDEMWIKVKMDQMAAQFVAHGLNHGSSILIE
jgi:hypothetical protein